MNKIKWTTENYLTVGKYRVPCVPDLSRGYNQGAGIKRNSKGKLLLKHVLWGLYKTRNDLLVDGFIEREIGRLIKKRNRSGPYVAG